MKTAKALGLEIPPTLRLSDLHWIDGFVSRERAIDEVIKIFTPPGKAPVGEASASARGDGEQTIGEVQGGPNSVARSQTIAVLSPLATSRTDVSHHGVSDVSPPPSSPALTARPNRRLILIGGAVVIAILGLGVVLAMRGRDTSVPSPIASTPKTENAATTPVEVTQAAALNESGDAYLAKKDYDRAIADYTEAIGLDPKYRDAYFHRGLAYQNGKQDFDRALADYQDVIRLDPSFLLAFYNRGLIYQYGKKDVDRAIIEYNEAIRLDPKYALAYHSRGIAYHNGKKDYDRAIADYNDAARLDPNNVATFRDRGLAYQYGKQDYDHAIADYTEAIRLDPKFALAFYNRGLAKQKIGDTAGGEADLASARALDPNVGN